MKVFVDSSFLLSLTGSDAHSRQAAKIAAEHENLLVTSSLVVFECLNRIHKWQLAGLFDEPEAALQKRSLDRLLAFRFVIMQEVRLKILGAHARRLIEHFSAAVPHGSMDVLHVAAACALRCDTLSSFDRNQRSLASAAGLKPLPARL